MSNNLNITQVTAGQSQKEATINAQAAEIDAALTEQYTLVGNVTPTLTSDELAQNMVFTADGAQTGAISMTLPASQKKVFLVDNSASSHNLSVIKGSTTIVVDPSETQMFYSDGTANGLIDFIPEAQTLLPVYNWYAQGEYMALEVIATIVIATNATLPIGLAQSQAYAEVTATAAQSIDIKLNGSSIGSIDFAIGTNAGTFTFTAQQALVAGDVLTFVAPTPVDTTLADVTATLVTV